VVDDGLRRVGSDNQIEIERDDGLGIGVHGEAADDTPADVRVREHAKETVQGVASVLRHAPQEGAGLHAPLSLRVAGFVLQSTHFRRRSTAAPVKPASKRLASRQQTDDDTDPAIGRMLVSSWQSMTPCARLARAVSIASAVDLLARAGARARSRPGSEQWMTYAEARLGRAAAVAVYGAGEGTSLEAGGPMDHLAVLLRVVDALNRCGIDYVVGGSLASSMSGEPRATVDVDLMIDLSADRIRCLVNALGEDFYAEEASLARAVRNRSHANVVHRATVTKIDLFIMGATPIEPQQMRRRRLVKLETIPAELYVYTPEDILLQKLRWFRLGGEVSDRQWQDVQGIVAVQGERLDLEYLRRAAEVVGVGDLLERVLRLR
jgi:hypothetical protein